MATIKDVARIAGVSIATVSAVLNANVPVSEKRTKRVWDAVEKTGYSPHGVARSLRLGHSQSIGLVVGDISNPFFTSLIKAIETCASAAGYLVVVTNTDDDPKKEIELLRLLREQRVAGLLLAPAGHGKDYLSSLSKAVDVPVVLVDRHLPDSPFDSVVVDNVTAARMATDYLVRLNHRRIAIVSGIRHLWTTEQRLQGFRDGLKAGGLPISAELEVAADSQIETAYEVVQRLLAIPKPPTAIFAANNLMTIGAIEAIMDMGFQCPEQISLAGIDDFPWISAIRPRLTTVAQPIVELGERAAGLLIERIEQKRKGENKPRPNMVALQPKLIIRDSCAAITRRARVRAASSN